MHGHGPPLEMKIGPLKRAGNVLRVPAEETAHDERLQGQEWNSPQSRKVMKNELGADLMLIGDINDVQDRSLNGRTTVKYFQVNLDLTDLETSEKAWIGSVEIKKVSNDR